MILVNDLTFLFSHLREKKVFSFDSETTGLKWYKTDYAFLWSFATDTEEFVVDLRKTDAPRFYEGLYSLLEDPEMHIVGTNSKFDLHMAVSQRGASTPLNARISDTAILMRLYSSDALRVGLEALGEEIGVPKDKTVSQWITKNKAYRFERLPSGEVEKIPRFDAVPEEILYKYAAQDARVSYNGYFLLITRLESLDDYNKTIAGDKSVFKALRREEELLKVLFYVEQRGICLDVGYTEAGLQYEKSELESARADIEKITGSVFIDSSKALTEAFGSDSDIIRSAPRTEKGNLSFTDSFLSSLDSPLAKAVTRYRKAHKKSGTYYSNFIHLCGKDGKIHTNFRQAQTATGRLSASDPNLQNVSNDDDSKYPIRGCFIAPEEYSILSIDYQAQEMRLLLDMAGEEEVAREIINGKDVHQAAADLMNCSRKHAKGVQFSIVYGAGDQKLAEQLGLSKEEATRLRRTYYSNLPNVASLISRVTKKAEKGFLANIAGRIYRFGRKFSYKGVNYLVQGSSAEITKTAMIECEKFLADKKTKLVLSVHDELLFYLHDSEHHLIEEIANIMRNSYAHEILPMDVGIEIGKRWSEMEEYGKTTRNPLLGEGS